ncbi:EF-P lysine aminoacylase EpmA [Marinobacteraceae bacterium S3BR75-40.1]
MSEPVTDWKPACSLDALRARAGMLAYIRAFFARRQVMEVQTPTMGWHTVTDQHIDSVAVVDPTGGRRQAWLQTSPEYPMKRLLAAGSGPIYQIAPVFRRGERGRRHNPEFTLLEWYRPGYRAADLMEEVADLVEGLLGGPRPTVRRYRELLETELGVDPFLCPTADLEALAVQATGVDARALDRDSALDLLMSTRIEPALAGQGAVFVHGYPASQAALARTEMIDGVEQAHRFELYVNGVELCNGYWELSDPAEQRRRFEQDNAQRRRRGQPEMPVDQHLLQALEAGLPDCAGVALGLDRLLMLKLGASSLDAVLPFPIDRA